MRCLRATSTVTAHSVAASPDQETASKIDRPRVFPWRALVLDEQKVEVVAMLHMWCHWHWSGAAVTNGGWQLCGDEQHPWLHTFSFKNRWSAPVWCYITRGREMTRRKSVATGGFELYQRHVVKSLSWVGAVSDSWTSLTLLYLYYVLEIWGPRRESAITLLCWKVA